MDQPITASPVEHTAAIPPDPAKELPPATRPPGSDLYDVMSTMRAIRRLRPEPVPRELWDWLVLSGWRNLPVKTDRRRALQAPQGALRELIEADPQERNRAHVRILDQAQPEA